MIGRLDGSSLRQVVIQLNPSSMTAMNLNLCPVCKATVCRNTLLPDPVVAAQNMWSDCAPANNLPPIKLFRSPSDIQSALSKSALGVDPATHMFARFMSSILWRKSLYRTHGPNPGVAQLKKPIAA